MIITGQFGTDATRRWPKSKDPGTEIRTSDHNPTV